MCRARTPWGSIQMPGNITYQGKPCKQGHRGLRYTQNRTCVECAKNYMTTWRKKNPERHLKKQRVRQRGTNEKRRIRNANRRAMIAAISGFFVKEDVDRLFEEQRGMCAAPHCENSLQNGYHVDHILAVSCGGTNWPDNLQLLCGSCNCSKRDKDFETWVGKQADAAR